MRKLHTLRSLAKVSDLMFDDMYYELVDDGRKAHAGQWRAPWRNMRTTL